MQNARSDMLEELKRLDELLGDASAASSPALANLYYTRGIVLQSLDRFDEARADYDRALTINPAFPEALYYRGNALYNLGRFDEAIASYDRALAVNPAFAEALNVRGNILQTLRRFDEALASYDRALAVSPGFVEAMFNRGNVLYELKRFDEALASYDHALTINPDFAEVLCGCGRIFRDRGLIKQAMSCLRRAEALSPSSQNIHLNLIFALNFDPSASLTDQQRERAQWDIKHARPFAQQIRPHINDRTQNRALRIGYVSSHFREHASAFAFGSVLLNHDKERFEVVCYSDTLKSDDATIHFRARADLWHDTRGLSDDELAELIRSDKIDILVDLVGHQAGNRLLVFARKPAPLQVTGWGEGSTGTGLQTMDYLLADPVLIPEAEREHFAESVVDLPNFLGYWTPEPLPEPGPLPALANGYITFGSFNRVAKITNPTIRTWASILRRLPSARLLLKSGELADAGSRTRLMGAFATLGISGERLTLLGGVSRESHFGAYQTIDIALDPFPHGGGMTTLDALWMGVPVVTWPGQTVPSRYAAASLTALGLTDFVAASPEAYVDLAVYKAADIEPLARLRAKLRTRVAESEFGDGLRYSRAVESAYRDMWRRWCADNS